MHPFDELLLPFFPSKTVCASHLPSILLKMDAEKQSAADTDEPSAFPNKTFDRDVQIRVQESAGAASISPSGRDVVLAK